MIAAVIIMLGVMLLLLLITLGVVVWHAVDGAHFAASLDAVWRSSRWSVASLHRLRD